MAEGGRARSRWTPAEEARLKWSWGEVPVPRLARDLGRTESAVRIRAVNVLGLGGTKSEDWESLSAAAARTGYAPATLRKVLESAGVSPRSVFFHGTRPKRMYRVSSVDAAVAAYVSSTETVRQAAVDRGMVPETLRRWLAEAGHHPPDARGSTWRLATAAIDAVVEERSRYETVREAALRHGMSENTMAAWISRVGARFRDGWSTRVRFVLKSDSDAAAESRSRLGRRSGGARPSQV